MVLQKFTQHFHCSQTEGFLYVFNFWVNYSPHNARISLVTRSALVIVWSLWPLYSLYLLLKIKELRNQGDENAKKVGARGGDISVVPSGDRGFEELMLLVSRTVLKSCIMV